MGLYLADLLGALLALAAFAQAGIWLLLATRVHSLHLLAWLGSAITLGIGLIGLQLLALGMLRVTFHLAWVAGPWLVAWAALLMWQLRTRAAWAWPTYVFQRPRPREMVLWAIVALTIAAVIFRATFHPIFEWDSWAIWDLKAEAFFYQRGLFPYIADTYYGLSHLEYPVMFPLAVTFVYMVLGRHSDIALVIPAILYAGLAMMVYGMLRRIGAGRGLATAGAAALVWVPNFLFWSQNLNADGPLAVYVTASTILAADYLREPVPAKALVAGILAGMATQTKIEGVLLVVGIVPFLAWQAWRRREARLGAMLFLLALIGIGAPWYLFQRSVTDYAGHLTLGNVQKAVADWSVLPAILRAVVSWLGDWKALGGYTALGPGLIVLAGLSALDGSRGLWLAQTGLAVVPSALFFLVYPEFNSAQNYNRYLVVFLVVGVGAMLVLAVEVFRRGGWQARLGRAALGLGFALILIGNIVPDASAEPQPPAAYTARPVDTMRYTLSVFPSLLPKLPYQRRELLDARAANPLYAQLIQVAQAVSAPGESVVLWVKSDALMDSFLLQRSYYLVYPRKVFLAASPGALRQAPNVGAVIRYDREDHPPDSMPVFLPAEKFGVHRETPDAATLAGLTHVIETQADFAEGIRLAALQPVALTSEEIVLLVWWNSLQAGRVDRKVFVHVWQGNTLIAQDDSPPALGTRLTSAWQSGDWIVDAHRLTMPAGTRAARVCIGQYQTTNGVRLLLVDGQDMLCQELTINP